MFTPVVGDTKLEKSLNRIFTTGTPGTPGTPGSPGLPAYSYSTVLAHPGYGVPQGWGYKILYNTDPFTGISTPYLVPVPASAAAAGSSNNTYASLNTAANITALVHVPATPPVPAIPGIPAIPASLIIDNNIGWNSGAFTVKQMLWGGETSFVIGESSAGVVVGLADSFDIDYRYVKHGIYAYSGIGQVIESGVLKDTAFTVSEDDTYSIRMINGAVSYLKNGVAFYDSLNRSNFFVHVLAEQYAAGDVIYNLDVDDETNLAEANVTLMHVQGGGFTTGNGAAISLMPLGSLGNSENSADAAISLRPLGAFGADAEYNFSNTSLQPLDGSGMTSVGLAPVYNFANFYLCPGLGGSGLALVGVKGSAAVSMRPMTGIGADIANYNYAVTQIAPLDGYGETGIEGQVWLDPLMYSEDSFTSAYTMFLVLDSDLGVSGIFSAVVAIPVSMLQSMGISAVWSNIQIMQALLTMSLGIDASESSIDPLEANYQVWAMNQETGGSTRYEQFNFNSFGKFQGKHYGAMSDGVYLLEGDDDDGDEIHASISLGKQDFGTTAEKRVPNAYIGVSSTGRMYMKVIANGSEYLYAARNDSLTQETQRFDIGKGMKANFFEFEIYNSNGADFDLSTVEFIAMPLSRRI